MQKWDVVGLQIDIYIVQTPEARSLDEEEDAEEVHTYVFPNPIQDRISIPATSKEAKQWK